MVLVAGCANEASHGAEDATSRDTLVMDDLARDVIDASTSEAVDAGTTDLGVDVGRRDVLVDASDVPWVDVSGILIPLDPSGVPAPGSECTSDASVRAGDPTIAPPRLVRPQSVSRASSQRPTLQWVLPDGVTGARVELCADRCCTRVLQTLDAEGTSVRPVTTLPPGVVFWRVFGRRGTAVGSRPSYTWEFGVRRRDAPTDTSWGTIRDFNGDGYDDMVVLSPQVALEARSDLQLMTGSERGLTAPMRSGLVVEHLPQRASIGDFNGDGIADVVWSDYHEETYPTPRPAWLDVVMVSTTGLRRAPRIEVDRGERCAGLTFPAVTDWNGDGYSDLITAMGFGCSSFNKRGDRASILVGYLGSASGLAPLPQWAVRLDGSFAYPAVYPEFNIGDVDLDGFGDVLLASDPVGASIPRVSSERVITLGGTEPPRYVRLTGASAATHGGTFPFGDVDGDGHSDFARGVGERVYTYLSSSGLGNQTSILRDPAPYPWAFGWLPSIGDVNGDGMADVLVSAGLSADEQIDGVTVNRGRVYVYLGSRAGLPAVPVWIERARVEGMPVLLSGFGSPMVSPGDINGDGFDDIAMQDDRGETLCVYHGRETVLRASPDRCLGMFWPSFALFL